MDGQGSLFTNNGTIANTGKTGIYVKNAVAINNGTIENNNNYGITAEENATAENYGIIQNAGITGMEAKNGAKVINQKDAVIRNTGSNGMYASSESTAVNNGVIENNGYYGMLSVGKNAESTNNGTISNKSNYGMMGMSSGKIVNNGIISNTGTYGMGTFHDDSQAVNNNIIENKSSYGMFMYGAGYMENSGTVRNTGDSGMYWDVKEGQKAARIINTQNGVIENTGNYGMYLADSLRLGGFKNTTVINDGIIQNKGDYGFYINTAGYAINNGTVRNTGNYASYVTLMGIMENNGLMELTGNDKTGMYSLYGGTSINNGTIKMNGQNTTGMYAYSATIINQGDIVINGTGKGMAAYKQSHIILGSGSTITINGTEKTYNGEEATGDGVYIYADETSDINNKGVISSDTRITINGEGKFVVNSATGGLSAKRLLLKNNLYIDSEIAMDSSEDEYLFKNIKTDEITGDGKIMSDSVLFNAKVDKEDSGYTVAMKRKPFNEVIKKDLGEILEGNYKNSESDVEKNKIYNSLKAIKDSNGLAKAEDEMTGSSVINNQTYQLFTQDKIISNGIKELMDRRSESVDTGIYANFLYSNANADTENGFDGYKGKSAGIVLGGMKKINENTAAGGFLGYLNTDINYKDSSNKQKLETWSIAGAVNTELTDKILWRNRINFNLGNNDSERTITFDGTNRRADGSFDSWSAGGISELEYSQKLNDIVTLKPSAGIALSYLKEGGYTETGAGGLNLNVDSNSAFSERIGAGLKADINVYRGENSTVKVTPKADYSYELGDPYDKRSIKMSAFDGTMDIDERDTGKNALNVGMNLECNYKNKFSLYTGYSTEVLSSKDYNVTVGFKYQF